MNGYSSIQNCFYRGLDKRWSVQGRHWPGEGGCFGVPPWTDVHDVYGQLYWLQNRFSDPLCPVLRFPSTSDNAHKVIIPESGALVGRL